MPHPATLSFEPSANPAKEQRLHPQKLPETQKKLCCAATHNPATQGSTRQLQQPIHHLSGFPKGCLSISSLVPEVIVADFTLEYRSLIPLPPLLLLFSFLVILNVLNTFHTVCIIYNDVEKI